MALNHKPVLLCLFNPLNFILNLFRMDWLNQANLMAPSCAGQLQSLMAGCDSAVHWPRVIGFFFRANKNKLLIQCDTEN